MLKKKHIIMDLKSSPLACPPPIYSGFAMKRSVLSKQWVSTRNVLGKRTDYERRGERLELVDPEDYLTKLAKRVSAGHCGTNL